MCAASTLQVEYREYRQRYRAKYGEHRTCVLMQVGSFYEVYQHESERDSYIKDIADVCNIRIATKENGVQTCGFPTWAVEKYQSILVRNNYTVVVYDQDPLNLKRKRMFAYIVSPGVNHTHEPHELTSYCAHLSLVQADGWICGTFASMDVHTGDVRVFTHSHPDLAILLGEMYKIVHMNTPNEYMLHMSPHIALEDVQPRLDLYGVRYHLVESLPTRESALRYVRALYEPHVERSALDAIQADMEAHPGVAQTLTGLFQFVFEFDGRLTSFLRPPAMLTSDAHLSLFNNCMYQLNIVDNVGAAKPPPAGRITCLLDMVNKCRTPMGRRLLRYQLLHPVCCTSELNRRYDLVERVADAFETLQTILTRMPDLERTHRRIVTGKAAPLELRSLHDGYTRVKRLFEACRAQALSFHAKQDEYEATCDDFIRRYRNDIDLEHEFVYVRPEYGDPAFATALREWSAVDARIKAIHDAFECAYGDESAAKPSKLVFSEKDDAFHIATTMSKGEALRSARPTVQVDGQSLAFTCTWASSACKFTCPELVALSASFVHGKRTLEQHMARCFKAILEGYQRYVHFFHDIVAWVGCIDVACNNAQLARARSYVRPALEERPTSALRAVGIRHPIVEVVRDQVAYVSNDVALSASGLLLYGVNAAGKSCLMKSVGIAVLMAQAGMFVACSAFTLAPFSKMLTRIVNKDNLFRDQSTFTHEMHELNALLQHADGRSLILGDELCSGTEHTSAMAIVTAGVHWLCERSSTFIFATHLHELTAVSEIVRLRASRNLEVKHLHVEYDDANHNLLFDRKLREGTGSNLYGIELCKFLNLPTSFVQHAEDIRKTLRTSDAAPVQSIFKIKTSRYNSKLASALCAVCESPASDTHHIVPQKDADRHDRIQLSPGHKQHKNTLHNLVMLCKDCHVKVTNQTIHIHGYVDTIKGRQLQCQYV